MRPTNIVDVGSARIDGRRPYQSMLDKGLCCVLGFEPQQTALDELNARKGPNEIYSGQVILDGSSRKLFHASAPGMTSLLTPSRRVLALFERFVEFGEIVAESEVETATLDDALEDNPVDFIKLDTQGTELIILMNAPRALGQAVAVQIEVSFIPLYYDQPTFGEVDLWMRSQGFIPHGFADIKAWPLATGHLSPKIPHQLLEADMVYVRDFQKSMTLEQWRHLALLAEHVFGSPDLQALAQKKVDLFGKMVA